MPDETPPPAASPELPLPGGVDASPPVAAPVGNGAPSNRGGKRDGAGRKPKAHLLADELARRGCGPSARPSAPPVAPLEPAAPVAPPFDAEAARLFFVTVLDAADEFNAQKVADLVESALEDRNLAEEFKGKAKIAPAMKKLAVDDAVNLARANNVTIGPGAGLLAACVQIGAQQMALRKEIKALAASRPT